jgi:hypothetical protein
MSSVSIFAGLANAKITESGSYLPAGYRFKLKIQKCQLIHPRTGVPAFVVDFEVLESNSVDVKVGEVKNWYQKSGDSFDAAVLEFLAAAFGFNINIPEQKLVVEKELAPASPQYAEAAVGPQQILTGKVVSVETQKRDTRAGKDFTKHNWTPAA